MPLSKEAMKVYNKKWTANNREKRNEHSRKWRTKNKEHVKTYAKRWWSENPEKYKAQCIVKGKGAPLRLKIIDYYGGKCACCGITDYEFLCIDHIDGGGNQRRKIHGTGYNFYRWIIRNGYPNSLRILCFNCNMVRSIYGYCPHESPELSSRQMETAVNAIGETR